MDSPEYPLLERILSSSIGKKRILWPFRELVRGSRLRRNPRNLEYMKRIIPSDYKNIEIAHIAKIDDLKKFSFEHREEIVLLWPDGNGYGWNKVERYIFHRKTPRCKVIVVNGRRRVFVLNRTRRSGFLIRRFIEKFLVFEFIFTAFFIIATPFFLFYDLIRGRK